MLKINNIFYSIQGEGIHIGKPTVFVRFAGCPFRCPYCDEPQALTDKFAKEYDVPELMHIIIKEFVDKYNCSYVEFTGGSPEIQDKHDLYQLCLFFKENYSWISLGMQMTGGLKISERVWNLVDNHKIDYKEPECNIPFIININKLTSRDEIKFVLDVDGKNWDWFIEKVKLFQYSNVNVIVSPKSDLKSDGIQEMQNAKKLTEKIMYARLPVNIQVLPRLQQLYWFNEKGR